MNSLKAALAAYSLLRDKEVTKRLGLDPADASRLSLALVTAADLAPGLAAHLLANHTEEIHEIERQERYTTAEPTYEDGEPVLNYGLSEGTRRCLELVDALRAIAATDPVAVRAA